MSTTEKHQGSMLVKLLVAPVIGMSACLSLAASPYLIDADCSKPGYAPVSLKSCLPETDIAKTDWEVSVPIDDTMFNLNRGQPFIQALPPAIFKLTLYGSGVIAGLVLLSALFSRWGTPSPQPIAIKIAEPWEDTHNLAETRRD